MAVTEANLETNFNTYIGDATTARVSAAQRLEFATEAVVWLQEELGNDHMNATYSLNYYDNVHYYKITSAIATLLEGADLRRGEKDQVKSFAHKSARELAEEIGQGENGWRIESSWSIERRDGDWYLVVNHNSKFNPDLISGFESLTDGGGTWLADTVNSDATNVTIDTNEFKTGTASLNFDVSVAQSGNNRATIYNSTLSSQDLSSFEDLGAWVFWVYIPDVSHFSSITLYWGSNSSNYWSATASSDVNGAAWVNGWNRVAILWSNSTATASPDSTAIGYIRADFNYTGSQLSDTDFRIDDLNLVRPEVLTFIYTSWKVGANVGGSDITAFGATTDVPFFSGKYDQYKYAVAHKMAALAFYGPLRNTDKALVHDNEAQRQLMRVKNLFPSAVTKEVKSFKVNGVSFRRSIRGRRA